MKRFEYREIIEAREHAIAGGQSLHVYDARRMPSAIFRAAPAVFRRHSVWAHLIDVDRERLVATAKRLGVRAIVVEREGTPMQHVDLCGAPLDRAIACCEDSAHARRRAL